MFKIGGVEKSSYYIDRIMDDMGEFAIKTRDDINKRFERNLGTARKDQDEVRLNKRKDLELEKIRFLNQRINRDLRKIINRFPKFAKLKDVYVKLIDTSDVNVDTAKEALERLRWIYTYCDELTQNTESKIKKAKTHDTIGFIMKKYLGKVNSLFKKEKKHFENLEKVRVFMKDLPNFLDLYTASIGGFPNVGKSTLMNKITGSDVEIQNYPFTTKGLMFGYLTYNKNRSVQLIDTPGLLGRSKNNSIEERAEIVLREFCDLVVFVFDFTESCGYDIEQQLKLFKKTSQGEKKVLVYLSKTDLFDEESENRFKELESKLKKYNVYKDSEELKEVILAESLKKTKAFDPTKLKVLK